MPGLLDSLRQDRPKKDDDQVLKIQKNGYIIYVGLNSFSNETLILSHPHRKCLWMHAMAAPGGHVVICMHERPDPPDDVLQFAGRLALRNSRSEARTVSVALLSDLYKPEDVGPGVWKRRKEFSLEIV